MPWLRKQQTPLRPTDVSQRQCAGHGERGFTLVELLVVIVVMVIIAGVILVQGQSSQSDIVLTNQAYEVALALREAQSFGVAVREAESGGSFDTGYGVYFSTSAPGEVVLFNDVIQPDNHIYDPGDPIVGGEPLRLEGDVAVSDVCGLQAGGGEVCASDGGFTDLHIAFLRPDPDAYITAGGTSYSGARVHLASPHGPTRTVTVYTTGQIAVD